MSMHRWDRLLSWPPYRVALLYTLLTLLLGAGIAGIFLTESRRHALNAFQHELMAISKSASDATQRALGTLDLIVAVAANEFRQGHIRLDEVVPWLHGYAASDKQLRALQDILLIDPDGRVAFSTSTAAVGVDLSDRDYVRHHHEHPDSRMFIGRPVNARTHSKGWVVPLSWPLREADGRLVGVFSVAIDWELYTNIFSGLLLRPDQRLILIDKAGTVYARDAAHWPDRTLPPERPRWLDEWLAQPSPLLITSTFVVAVTAVPETDLQLVAAHRIDNVLQDWWHQIWGAAAAVGVISLGMGLLSWWRQCQSMALRQALHAAEAAKAEAERSEQAKGQFLAAMSHEIRTPMTGVLGMTELLAKEPLSSRQQDQVRAIRSSGQHLLHIINDILDFSRLEAGGVTLEQVDFSLATLLEDVRMLMLPQAAERGLALSLDLDEHSPPVVRGDPTRLQQVLINLVGNGLKFTSSGGVSVVVRCGAIQDGAAPFRFEVRDTGIGISEESRRRLFQAFTQADQTIARRFGGTGLGLAISRYLVTAMGGEIGVVSEPGKGSTFFFEIRLPIGSILTSGKSGRASSSRSLRPLRILVADDVALNRELLQASLEQNGHQVLLVENGEQAVARVGQGGFDVVLMDVQMPVMDGIEATRRIRMLPRPAGQVPVVALTANVMEAEQQRCLAAGMNRVLTKPIDWDRLFDTLAAVTAAVDPAEPVEPVAAAEPRQVAALLDQQRIDSLRKMAGPAKLEQFLANAMTSARTLAAEVEHLQDDLEAVVKPAHRLAGTAPSFGLLRIGILARMIEQAAAGGRTVEGLVGQLQQAVCDTEAEMQRLEL
jgi:signal transduction histidine kinase/AmiR/NasT family two-component response regulator/HPt (histidine-containing phosphotransfer) domain-containing protein